MERSRARPEIGTADLRYDWRMAKLFISHASHDKALVEAVVDLLEGGVGVPHSDIFCSSLKGQSIRPGDGFVDSIHKNLDKATCALALVSEAFYASPFCWCELGAVWIQSKSLLPVLVRPIDYADLKAVLGGVHVSKIDKEDDLDELRDEVARRLEITPHGVPRWNSKRKAFMEALPSRITSFKGPVPQALHEKAIKELSAYKDEYAVLEEENQKLKTLVEDLKRTKDVKDVAKVVAKHSTAIDQFRGLVKTAQTALDPLPRKVRQALYHHARGEAYIPRDDEWEAIKVAEEYGQLRIDPDDGSVEPDTNDSKVGRAEEALNALENWLASASATEEFYEWYGTTYKNDRAELRLKSFWERHLRL